MFSQAEGSIFQQNAKSFDLNNNNRIISSEKISRLYCISIFFYSLLSQRFSRCHPAINAQDTNSSHSPQSIFQNSTDPQSRFVSLKHSNRTMLKTSRLTRACHSPVNALASQGAPLKDAPNLHSPSHCPGTQTDWCLQQSAKVVAFSSLCENQAP